MAENSKIEWTNHTFNPWIGCTNVSPGCDHCYAETMAGRYKWVEWGAHGSRKRTSKTNWKKPLTWNRKAERLGIRYKVFCASLADVFDNHKSIDHSWRSDLWQLIQNTPNLDWQLLTKRPQNIKKMLPDNWGNGYPNVWLGTTVENQQEADRRIPHLLAVPAKVRFLSCEPLLGPVDLGEWQNHPNPIVNLTWLDGLDWVICGGESGPKARPMHPDWARSLRDQCNAAGVPFHFKQFGEWYPGINDNESDGLGWQAHLDDSHDITARDWEGYWKYCEENGQGFFRVGKSRAGRMLDGKEWNEVPG